jgi:mRNA interferase HigB
MRIITRRRLVDFWERFPDARDQLQTWYRIMKRADYGNPAEVKAQFGSASILKKGRMVFNICGNKYRLVATMRYDLHSIFIGAVMTHAEYDARIRDGTL